MFIVCGLCGGLLCSNHIGVIELVYLLTCFTIYGGILRMLNS
jgi:hypothetical protein